MGDITVSMVFVSAALALAFAPGPGMLYVLSRSISGGRSVGIASSLGAACGGVIHVFAAALGISALLATSAVAFTIVKYLGAAFLVYLGIKMIFFGGGAIHFDGVSMDGNKRKERVSAFYQGIVSEVLNPKTAIFFLAFIPQFIRPDAGSVFWQFTVLGMIVVLLNMVPDLLISFFSHPIEQLWNRSASFRKRLQATSGVCLVGLGVYLASAESTIIASSKER